MGKQGNLARIATMVKQIRSEMPNVVLLDGGDTFLCTYVDYFAGGPATISAIVTCNLYTGTPQIEEVQVNNLPIDPERVYSFASLAHTLLGLHKTIPMEITFEPPQTTREVLVDYVRAHGTIYAPITNNIVLLNKSPG